MATEIPSEEEERDGPKIEKRKPRSWKWFLSWKDLYLLQQATLAKELSLAMGIDVDAEWRAELRKSLPRYQEKREEEENAKIKSGWGEDLYYSELSAVKASITWQKGGPSLLDLVGYTRNETSAIFCDPGVHDLPGWSVWMDEILNWTAQR